jgi:hypothetical protein
MYVDFCRYIGQSSRNSVPVKDDICRSSRNMSRGGYFCIFAVDGKSSGIPQVPLKCNLVLLLYVYRNIQMHSNAQSFADQLCAVHKLQYFLSQEFQDHLYAEFREPVSLLRMRR